MVVHAEGVVDHCHFQLHDFHLPASGLHHGHGCHPLLVAAIQGDAPEPIVGRLGTTGAREHLSGCAPWKLLLGVVPVDQPICGVDAYFGRLDRVQFDVLVDVLDVVRHGC